MRKNLKDYFIPHEGNDYKPHSLQKAAMTGMVLMVLLSFTLANVQSFLWVASDWMVSTVLPAVLVELTNTERADGSLGQLTRSSTLDAAATLKAQHMAEKEYFAHHSPDGVSPWFWFAQADYNFVHAGENLAVHFSDSGEVVHAWMNSPTHRANIMNGNYTEIGIGTAEGEYEGFKTVFVVQLFGTPAAQPAVAGVQEPAEPVTVAEVPTPAEEQPEDNEVLAEAVAITEDIEIVGAEPVAVIPAVTPADEQVEIQKESIYSDFISTSTGSTPASIDPTSAQKMDNTPYFFKILAQPDLMLQLMYITIGALVLVSLLISIFIEIRRQQPLQIAYALGLLVLMSGLFYMHEILSSGALIV